MMKKNGVIGEPLDRPVVRYHTPLWTKIIGIGLALIMVAVYAASLIL